jgi:subtilisin family serine protease
MERPDDLSAQDAAARALNLPLAGRSEFARRISTSPQGGAPLQRARNAKKASADSAEKNAGARGKGGSVLKRRRRIVRQVRPFRTIFERARTGGCSAADALGGGVLRRDAKLAAGRLAALTPKAPENFLRPPGLSLSCGSVEFALFPAHWGRMKSRRPALPARRGAAGAER